MVHSCCICKTSSEKDPSTSFHRFPKNEQQKAKWVAALGLDGIKLSPSSKICSKHFPNGSFCIREGGRRDLKPTALPFLNSAHSEDSLVPQEVTFQPSYISKDQNEPFSFFVTDNFELFPDEILKSEYVDISEPNLSETMEMEVLDSSALNYFVQEISDNKSALSSSASSICRSGSDFVGSERLIDINLEDSNEDPVDMENILTKISADNNFKWKAYFKQCSVEDFATPEMAKRNLELGKKEIDTHQKKIKILKQQNRRLKERIGQLKYFLKKRKNNNCTDLEEEKILNLSDEIDL